MLLILALIACKDDTPADSGDSAAPEVADSAEALSLGVADEGAWAFDANLLAAEVLGELLMDAQVADYAEDGELNAAAAPPSGCAQLSMDQSDLVVDYGGCDNASGSIRLSWERGQPTVVTLEDDFAVGSQDLDGSLELQSQPREGEYDFDGSLTITGEQTVTLSLELHFRTSEGLTVYGGSQVELDPDGEPLSATVTLGTEAAPLVLALPDCRCPESGLLSAALGLSMGSVEIDLDELVRPRDGVDDYPPVDVPLSAPVEVAVAVDVDFQGTCGDQLVSVSADDVAVDIAKADLEAAVDAACASGAFTQDQCDDLALAMPYVPDPLSIRVPASTLAAAAEPSVQSAVDGLCPAS
ncbi:MAG: hypothetical protein H6741_17535 [Alphaproteobacteria bacterium]|nr:hypothetical protein [Alphaproteobacteria bacterium]MCB9794521.1 hypothetical protein [Alphaproteobacteria bacterium]